MCVCVCVCVCVITLWWITIARVSFLNILFLKWNLIECYTYLQQNLWILEPGMLYTYCCNLCINKCISLSWELLLNTAWHSECLFWPLLIVCSIEWNAYERSVSCFYVAVFILAALFRFVQFHRLRILFWSYKNCNRDCDWSCWRRFTVSSSSSF